MAKQARRARKVRSVVRTGARRAPATGYALRDEVVERALLSGEHAGLLEAYLGPEGYEELRALAGDAARGEVRGGPRVLILPGIQSSPVVPLSENFTIAKLGIDATRPLDKPSELFEPAGVPAEVMRKVEENWAGYVPERVLTP